MLWDRAVYLGPPDGNYGGPAIEQRGMVLHIAEGSYQGTISWQRNPVSDVSSQFIIGLGGFDTGEVAQMLDTSVTAWTQGAGNGRWVSVENAGFHYDQFTPQQIEANAQLYAWLMATHAAPPQLANSPAERGLGYHGMGGAAWGNHPDCPGPANVALREQILARAIEINSGVAPTPPEPEEEFPDMLMVAAVNEPDGSRSFWAGDGIYHRRIETEAQAKDLVSAIKLFYGSPRAALLTYGDTPRAGVLQLLGPIPAPTGGSSGGGGGPVVLPGSFAVELTGTVTADA